MWSLFLSFSQSRSRRVLFLSPIVLPSSLFVTGLFDQFLIIVWSSALAPSEKLNLVRICVTVQPTKANCQKKTFEVIPFIQGFLTVINQTPLEFDTSLNKSFRTISLGVPSFLGRFCVLFRNWSLGRNSLQGQSPDPPNISGWISCRWETRDE